MSTRYDDARVDRDVLRIPVIRVAYALSLLIHAVLLWPWMPHQRFLTPDEDVHKEATSRFQVRIEPRTIPSPPAPAATPSRPPLRPARAPVPPAAPSQPSPAPVIALQAPGAAIPPPAPPAPVARAPAPVIGDMAALIEARRRARGDPAPFAPPAPPPVEDENARRDRIVAQNLGSGRAPAFGEERRNSGGIFSVEHLYYDSADFMFYGWNRDIRRNTRQVIEVRKGNNSDIRIAVVRRMIAIIREYEQGDFRWDSIVLRRSVILSARVSDSAYLEDFLLREFFPEFARAR